MSDAEIIELARRVRSLQKRYFRERKANPHADDRSLLAIAKRAEAELDAAIEARVADQQPSLFEE